MGMSASQLSSSSKNAALEEAENGVRSYGTCAKRYYSRNKRDWAAALLKNGAKIAVSAAGGVHGMVSAIIVKTASTLFSHGAHAAMKIYRSRKSGGMNSREHVSDNYFLN